MLSSQHNDGVTVVVVHQTPEILHSVCGWHSTGDHALSHRITLRSNNSRNNQSCKYRTTVDAKYNYFMYVQLTSRTIESSGSISLDDQSVSMSSTIRNNNSLTLQQTVHIYYVSFMVLMSHIAYYYHFVQYQY